MLLFVKVFSRQLLMIMFCNFTMMARCMGLSLQCVIMFRVSVNLELPAQLVHQSAVYNPYKGHYAI